MRFLASDLDGTLVHENRIHEDDIKAISKLKEKGHKFIISTGRSYKGVEELINNYDIDYDYLLLCNGGLIIDGNNEIVLDEWVPSKIAQKIVNEFYDYGNILIYLDNSTNTILVDNHNVDKSEILDMFDYFSDKVDVATVMNMKDNYKIVSVFATDKNVEKAEKIKNKIKDKYGDYVEVYRNQYFVDIAPKGCSKGAGLLKILEIENKKEDSLFTVGDSFNDISMFNITENSYTFNHAEDKVKKHAKNKIDYVYEVVNKILE
ncbi:Cof-type HAD-IIB family hydrolase [Clostridium sp. LP20]|uniref:Cof-type HAD-IIB family hydrolase n=1 Tax=Clostridium sp. LP20 TaxID=3418665 RepID=UPI003EE5F7C5